MTVIVRVVPAAGYAERLQPLDCSKETIEVGGRPLIDYLVERMRVGGARELRVVTRPEKEDVIAYAESVGATVVLAHPANINESFVAGMSALAAEDIVLLGFPDSIWSPLTATAPSSMPSRAVKSWRSASSTRPELRARTISGWTTPGALSASTSSPTSPRQLGSGGPRRLAFVRSTGWSARSGRAPSWTASAARGPSYAESRFQTCTSILEPRKHCVNSVAPLELSVVIPLYNAERYIGDLLDSLAAQEWDGDWEVVIADNGSSDRGVEIARGYRARLPRLRIIDASSQSGTGYARTTGVRAAEGDSLVFIDDDDIPGEGYVAAMGEALRSHSFVCGRQEVEKLNPEWTRKQRPSGQYDGPMMWNYDFLPYAAGGTLGIKTRPARGPWRLRRFGPARRLQRPLLARPARSRR